MKVLGFILQKEFRQIFRDKTIIAMMFATDLVAPDPVQAETALAKWKGIANDLGKPGRDDVYGEGELGGFRDSVLGNTHR